MLFSGIVDASLKRNAPKELAFIAAHEVAHHAAGHTAGWKQIIVLPAFVLRSLATAHSRACEYTADALGLAVVEDRQACANALVLLAHGSEALGNQVDLNEFLAQESDIPALPAFINEISATHPRTTRRIAAIARAQVYASTPPPMPFTASRS